MSEIRHALLAVLCSGPPQRVDQAWPFGLGSQLTTLLDNAKDLVVNGRSLNLTGVRIVAGDAIPSAGNAAHGEYLKDCPTQSLACLFASPAAHCSPKSNFAASSLRAATALLSSADHYSLVGELTRLVLHPTPRLAWHVASILNRLPAAPLGRMPEHTAALQDMFVSVVACPGCPSFDPLTCRQLATAECGERPQARSEKLNKSWRVGVG